MKIRIGELSSPVSRHTAVNLFGCMMPVLLLTSLSGCQLTSDMPYKSTFEAISTREDQRVEAEEIFPYLEYDHTMVRLRAALALARLRSHEAVEFIEGQLNRERDQRVSETLLFALGQIGSDRASDTVLKFFASRIEGVRAAAVEAAGKIGDGTLTNMILDRLREDRSAQVRAEACIALFRMGAKRYEDRPELDAETVEKRRSTLENALLNDENPGVRWRAAYALAGFEDPLSSASLRRALLHDEDLWVRVFSARGLRAVENKPATQKALSEACEVARRRGDWQVVVEAISALGNYDDLETAAFLIDYLLPKPDTNFHVRAAAARTLGRFASGGETIVKAIIRATTDQSRTVVAEAIVALGTLGGMSLALRDSALELLEKTSENNDRFIRMKTVKAAGMMGLDGLDILLDLAHDESVRVRCCALEALSDPIFSVERDALISAAEEAVALDDLSLRYTGAVLLKELGALPSIPLLRTAYHRSLFPEMAESRLKIIEALETLAALAAQAGDPVDDAIFHEAVNDEDFHVREAASRALASLSGELIKAAPITFKRQVTPRVGIDYMNGQTNPVAQFITEKGEFWIELFKEDAPTHVLNFIQLARSGFYNKLTFHRVVSNFVVQGLDPRGDGWGFNDIHLRDEINRRKFLQGYLGMPNSGRDTGGCQIFITHCPTPHLDGNYTVFGRVIDGMEVVDHLEEGDQVLQIYLK
ncbi:MAG: HEAT repeat domain-containing protein [Planctomycetes bacterium]|nr:HEAT repeat domain-containing protein [Planctomycetota bacterium]